MKAPRSLCVFLRDRADRIMDSRAPDMTVERDGRPYMLRWNVIWPNPLFNVFVHRFVSNDTDPVHDHPWPSVSIVLLGSYRESGLDGMARREFRDVVFRSATAPHRITLFHDVIYRIVRRADGWGYENAAVAVEPRQAVTLFITGPKVRDWGFHCPNGWVHWRDFTAGANGEFVGRGCGEQ